MMSGIRGGNTKPEVMVRHALHARGLRYRLHDRSLPGKPDIVFPRYKAVLFAHGCFWHGHDCGLFRWPSTRPEFWRTKITRNRFVDARNTDALEKLGWRQAIVWECALKGKARLPLVEVIDRCENWLKSRKPHLEGRGMS